MKTNGIGISNLRSGVQLVEGNLQYASIENEETTAIVRVPYKNGILIKVRWE